MVTATLLVTSANSSLPRRPLLIFSSRTNIVIPVVDTIRNSFDTAFLCPVP